MAEAFIGGKRVLSTGEQTVAQYVWDTGTLSWIPQTASAGGGGPSSDVNITNSTLAVTQSGTWTITTGGLTDAQLRATPVPVSGTVSVGNFPGTQPISAAALPLPSGAASETTQAAINTKTPALGQALMAASTPVVLASNQSAIPVTGTFWQATQPVSIASMPSTPVTGTFWQATQPVSIASWTGLTDTQLRATALPVSLASTTVSNTVTTSEAPPTAVSHALASVTTAGTRIQLTANACKSIVVKALGSNAGTIYVGGSTVSSANGFPLAAGDTVALDISNTNVVWIDSSINAQSVAWMANT